MAVTAHIDSITATADGTGNGVVYMTQVTFSDPVSGYNQIKVYPFSTTSAIAADRTVIQADLNTIKAAVAGAANLQSLVGTVLT